MDTPAVKGQITATSPNFVLLDSARPTTYKPRPLLPVFRASSDKGKFLWTRSSSASRFTDAHAGSCFLSTRGSATCSQSIIHSGGRSAENLSPQSTSSVCVLKVGFANQSPRVE